MLTVEYKVGRDSADGTANDSLWPGRSGDGIPVRSRFSALVHTGLGAHSYTMGTGSFSEAKRPERGVNHPTLFRAEVKEREQLHLYPLCAFMAYYRATFHS
jgi:hypothetical protein